MDRRRGKIGRDDDDGEGGNGKRWREREEEGGGVDNTRITMREFCSVGGGGNGGGGRNEFTHNIPKTFTFSVKEKQSFVITIYVCVYIYIEVELPFDPSCPSVGWLVGQSVCHNYRKGLKVTLPYTCRSTC